jgi:8-oxo-dGTP diphosphatase
MSDYNPIYPRRRITAGALFFDQQGQLLIVRPTYREDGCWLIPGGIVEEDESPLQGCLREVREELGSDLPLQALLCVEYQSLQPTRPQSVHFIFHGGLLHPAQVNGIRLPADELAEFRFCTWDGARELLCRRLADRLTFALKALEEQRVIYLENLAEVAGR